MLQKCKAGYTRSPMIRLLLLILISTPVFAKVEKRERAAVFAINTGVSAVDRIAKSMVAPWVNSSYDKVVWMLSGDFDNAMIDQRWEKLIKKYKTIDYFSYVHTGGHHDHAASYTLMKSMKPGQLRLVYTTACHSGDVREFVETYNAGVAIGHRGNSDSTLFSMSFVRKWVKGNSIQKSMKMSYARGSRILKYLGPLELRRGLFTSRERKDEILETSEMLATFTEESAFKDMTIDSEVPARASLELRHSEASEL
jgi:hypothetical protein